MFTYHPPWALQRGDVVCDTLSSKTLRLTPTTSHTDPQKSAERSKKSSPAKV